MLILVQTILLYLSSLQIPGRKKSLEPCIQDQFEFSKRVLIGFRMENNGLLESNQVSDLFERLTPILQNIVSTVNLDCTLDLRAIALHARNAEYNPKRFAAVIIRIKEPKITALIFSSGKIVCTGAKTQQHSHLAARRYAKIVQKLGFDVKFKDFKIQNMVASCNVTFPLSLVHLGHFHYEFSTYEPELFPGLIYRMRQPKITMLIFPSGKLVITGAKTEPEIHKAFANIYPVLMFFRIDIKDK